MDRNREYSWSDPMALAEAARGRSGLDFMLAMMRGELPPPPIAQTLGFEVVEVSEGRAVFSITPGEHLYNPIGMVHGGVAATMLDTVTGCAVHTTLPAGTGYTSVDLSVKYLRPLTAATPARSMASAPSSTRAAAPRWPRANSATPPTDCSRMPPAPA